MKVIQVVGARPNFMKVGPIHRAFKNNSNWESIIVHTGQHFDKNMSDIFFKQLELPEPTYFLGVGSGSQTQVTAKIMLEFEKIVEKEAPDLILVVGDVTSTLACTLVAVKMGIKVAHVESGLRSFDRSMPEEINRILTDSVSDFLFVTEQSGLDNLKKEGVSNEKVFFVGNVMIDSLVYYLEKAKRSQILNDLGINQNNYIVMTMHRPANVDSEIGLKAIIELVALCANHIQVIFPIHPRTIANLARFGLLDELKKIINVQLIDPLGYLEFVQLMANSAAILTDSGGIQEETTYLGVPCLTFRNSTERPITVTIGTNHLLADLNPKLTFQTLVKTLNGQTKKGQIPPLWDGNAAIRIVQKLELLFN